MTFPIQLHLHIHNTKMSSYAFIVFHPSAFKTIELYLEAHPYEYVDGYILKDGNCKMIYKSNTVKKAYDLYHMLKDDVSSITIWNNCTHFYELIENEGKEVFRIWLKDKKTDLVDMKNEHIDGDSYFPIAWEDAFFKLLSFHNFREFLVTHQ